jgi:hypothetical protein
METGAVAVHVSTDKIAFERYIGLSGRSHEAPRAIGAVRSLIPRLPEVWGALSQAAVHPNVIGFGPTRDGDGRSAIQLFAREVDLVQDRQTLRAISLGAVLVLRAAELVLCEEAPAWPGWLQLPGGSMLVTSTAKRLVEKRYREFTSGSQDPLQTAEAPDEASPPPDP